VTLDVAYRLLLAVASLTAFTSLVVAGAFAPVAAGVAYLLILGGAFWEASSGRAAAWFWRVADLVAIVVLAGWIAKRYEVTEPLVYFLVYLHLNKLWNLRSHRDHVWLFVVCFFEALLATLFSQAPGLFLMIAGFVVAFAMTLALFDCKREREQASVGDVLRPLPVPRRFLGLCGALAGGVWVASLLVFPLVPRTRETPLLTRYLPAPPPTAQSGFSDDVYLGAISEIQLDPTIVMRVEPADLASQEYFLSQGVRLRALSLRDFDGRRWSNYGGYGGSPYEITGRYGEAHVPRLLRDVPVYRATIYMEPYVTDFLFCPLLALKIAFPSQPQLVRIDLSVESIRLRHPPESLFQYATESVAEPEVTTTGMHLPSLSELAVQLYAASQDVETRLGGVTHDMLRGRVHRYLRVPSEIESSLDYEDLGRTIAGWGVTGYALARRIETFLRTNYQYSLQPPSSSENSPVLDFLFNSRQGHCELFSSAMVLLLRSQGMPARAVVGYYSMEWDAAARHFVVRQEHAHSWVEAWIDGYGWKTFDPTPPSGVGGRRRADSWVSRLARRYELLRFNYYKYVVDFGKEQQRPLFQWFQQQGGRAAAALRQAADRAGRAWQVARGHSVLVAVALWVCLMGLAVMIVLYARHGKRSAAATTTRARPRPPALHGVARLYEGILDRLEAMGYRRAASQTPDEFARSLALTDEKSFGVFPVITRIYCRARFGWVEPDAEETARMRNFAQALRHPRRPPTNS